MDYNHVMIDLETLGLEPGCAVLSIGLVHFNTTEHGVEQFEEILKRSRHWAIDIGTLMSPYTIDPVTRRWHEEDASRAKHLGDLEKMAMDAGVALEEITKEVRGYFVWGNSPSFDCNILRNLLFREKIHTNPWPFWAERDVRTALDMGGVDKKKIVVSGFIAHHADHDAAFQVHCVQQAYKNCTNGIGY